VFDNYCVQKECGGIVCRLAIQSLAFLQLARGQSDVSVVALCEHIRAVMKHHSLDLAEISHLTSFCFQQISSGRDLDIDAFCKACSASDRVCLEHARGLFDADRQMSCMERFFTPRELQQEQQGVHESRSRGTFHLWVERPPSDDPEGRRVKLSVPSSEAELADVLACTPASDDRGSTRFSTLSTSTAKLEVELQQLSRRCAGHESQIAELQGSIVELQRQLTAQAETCNAEFARFGQESLSRDAQQAAGREAEAHQEEHLQGLLAAAETRARMLGAHLQEVSSQPQGELHTSLERLLRLESEVWALLEVQKETEQREDAVRRSRLERLEEEVRTLKTLSSPKPSQPDPSGSHMLPLRELTRPEAPTSVGTSGGSSLRENVPAAEPSGQEPARPRRRSPWREKMLARPPSS